MRITMSMILAGLSERYICDKGGFYNPNQCIEHVSLVDDGRAARHDAGMCFVAESPDHPSLAGAPYESMVIKAKIGSATGSCAIKVLSDVCLTDIKDAIKGVIARYEAWSFNLMDLNLHGGGLEELVDFAHGMFGNPITIVDENYRLWAHTKEDAMDDVLWTPEEESVQGDASIRSQGSEMDERGFVEYLSALRKKSLLVDFETSQGTKLAACAVIVGSGSVMGVNIVEKNKEITHADIECLKFFAAVVRAKFKAMEFSWQDSSGSYYALLQDVVRGNLLDNSELKARLNRFWIDLEKMFTVFVITGRNGFLKYRQLCQIEDELTEVFSQGKCVISARTLVVFVNHDNPIDQALIDGIRRYARDNNLAVGVSETRSDDCSLRVLLEQAQFALRVLKRVDPEGCFAEYERFRAYYLLDVCSRRPDWQRYLHGGLLALAELDADSEFPLMETLRCLVENHGKRTAAAKDLGIQRNTLQYRIGKIEELCSVNLSDQDAFDFISFSIKLMDYCKRDFNKR